MTLAWALTPEPGSLSDHHLMVLSPGWHLTLEWRWILDHHFLRTYPGLDLNLQDPSSLVPMADHKSRLSCLCTLMIVNLLLMTKIDPAPTLRTAHVLMSVVQMTDVQMTDVQMTDQPVRMKD